MIASQLDTYLPPPSRWTRWQREEPVLVGYDLCGVRGEMLDRAVPADRKDALLAALIRCGQRAPDPDAKLAVTVCLLPGLRRIASRYRDIIGSHDVWAELLVAVWERVGSYDLDRRPGRVAANLLWDSTNRLLNVVRRERAWRDTPMSMMVLTISLRPRSSATLRPWPWQSTPACLPLSTPR